MVSKFEQFVEGGYAKELEENGYPDKAVDLRALVKSYREDGMAEVFPQKTEFSIGQEQLPELINAREQILNILAGARVERRPILNSQLADGINKGVGQYLGDEVRVRNLIFNSTLGIVDKNVMKVYSSCLSSFVRNGYRTLGEIRDTDPKILLKGRTIGKTFLNFAKAAFARPQAEKQ